MNQSYRIIHKPAGWETARGGSMTALRYLSTDLSTLTVFYACWEVKPGSKSCYFHGGEFLGNILMANAILREVNILLEGLEIECFVLGVCLKPAFRSASCFHFAAALSQVSFSRRYGSIHCVASNMCASSPSLWLTILQNACHSAPQGWDVKGGMPQNACWRLGGGEVEARQTLKHDRAIPKTTVVQVHTREMQWNCL